MPKKKTSKKTEAVVVRPHNDPGNERMLDEINRVTFEYLNRVVSRDSVPSYMRDDWEIRPPFTYKEDEEVESGSEKEGG